MLRVRILDLKEMFHWNISSQALEKTLENVVENWEKTVVFRSLQKQGFLSQQKWHTIEAQR